MSTLDSSLMVSFLCGTGSVAASPLLLLRLSGAAHEGRAGQSRPRRVGLDREKFELEKRTCLSPGLLPTKDDAAVRPANVVARPDRDAWGIEDGPTMRKHFRKAFLCSDFDDNGRLSEHRRSDDCSSGRDVDARHVGQQACVCDGLLGRRLRSVDEDTRQQIVCRFFDAICITRSRARLRMPPPQRQLR